MRGLRVGRGASACCLALTLLACDAGPTTPTQAEPLAQFFLAPAPDSRGPLLLVSRFEVTEEAVQKKIDARLEDFDHNYPTLNKEAEVRRAHGDVDCPTPT